MPAGRLSMQKVREVLREVRLLQIPAHRGQSFRRIADSIPVIADSFS